MLQAGDKLIIGGGMHREVVAVRHPVKWPPTVTLRDPQNQSLERVRLAQILRYLEDGWVVREPNV